MTNIYNYTLGIYGIQDINNSGIPMISHDHGIAIMHNGKVLFNIQLERLDRNKYSNAMQNMLYGLLKEKKLLDKNCNMVFVDNILGRSFVNSIGNIRFEAPINQKLKPDVEDGRLWWLDRPKKAYVLNHELAHLGSCLPFYGAFKENSLLVHFDGGASQSNFSVWLFKNGKLVNLEYHWELKWLSSLFNANALTFAMVKAKQHELNSVPGKFMGFASYGKYDVEIEQWLKENQYFENIWGSISTFFKALELKFGVKLKFIDQKNPIIQNIAATIHHVFVRESFKEIEKWQVKTKTNYLYYSGGAALNIVLNTKLVESNMFNDVFIPPCSNDSGLALGAAAFCEWREKYVIKAHSPFLNNWGIENYTTSYTDDTIKQVANMLINNKIVGISNGYGEIGPRALGNRSIICLASSKKIAKKISMVHKKREWYRPVAPIMLEKNAKHFTGLSVINHLSRYMLLDFNILKNKRKELEGAIHVNGTARIQTVFKRSENSFIYDLLNLLDAEFGIKALINTSFNTKDEPIVHTLNNALQSAKNMGLDAVVLNGKIEILS